jgi:hypothetical protein
MYQSGTVPAEICAGLNGPKFQIGLIWKSPPSTAVAPITTAVKPPALSANTGTIRTPTTLVSLRRRPGNWVCFWYQTRPTWIPINASNMPGMSNMCTV